MRSLIVGGLGLMLLGLSAGCERAAYMAPPRAPYYAPRIGGEMEREYERTPYYRAPGYRPFGEREFGDD